MRSQPVIDPERFPIGTRVLIRGGHQWAGHAGVVNRYETIRLFQSYGALPVVRLDNDSECFVYTPRQMQRLPG